jgi:S1-C subfamily serine protease
MKTVPVLLCTLLLSCATAAPSPEPSNDAPGYLGFSFAYYPPEDGKAGWLLVQHIHPDGPAESAGLQPQMVVTAINGRALDFTEDLDLLNLLGAIRPLDRVRLTLGGQKQLTIVAAEMPPEALRRWRANFERR